MNELLNIILILGLITAILVVVAEFIMRQYRTRLADKEYRAILERAVKKIVDEKEDVIIKHLSAVLIEALSKRVGGKSE